MYISFLTRSVETEERSLHTWCGLNKLIYVKPLAPAGSQEFHEGVGSAVTSGVVISHSSQGVLSGFWWKDTAESPGGGGLLDVLTDKSLSIQAKGW